MVIVDGYPVPNSLGIRPEQHGTRHAYNKGCRCKLCTEIATITHQRQIEDNRKKSIPNHVHGTANGYRYWSCRCTPCTRAHTADCKAFHDRRKNRLEETDNE